MLKYAKLNRITVKINEDNKPQKELIYLFD